MKQYAIGLITGILITASAVMFMGATNGDSEIGRYDGFAAYEKKWMIDTTTGDLYEYRGIKRIWVLRGGFKK